MKKKKKKKRLWTEKNIWNKKKTGWILISVISCKRRWILKNLYFFSEILLWLKYKNISSEKILYKTIFLLTMGTFWLGGSGCFFFQYYIPEKNRSS